MFHQNISHECCLRLESHPRPSDILGRAFFGSKHFAPERTILSLGTSSSNSTLSEPPEKFDIGETFLLWTVAVKSPLELILTWELQSLGLARGATQLSFDPSLRRVYQGNALDNVPDWAMPLIPAHERYAKYLLRGMVDEIERMAASKR